jgi:ESS family glutamate:Na+ symporter
LPQRWCCYWQKTRSNRPFLKKYTIPEPVAGGLLVALALLV